MFIQCTKPSAIAFNALTSLEPDSFLKLGDQGRDVQKLQIVLKDLGLYLDALDGQFALKTERALLTLQQILGIDASGVFCIETWYALTYWAEEQLAAELAQPSPAVEYACA